MLGPFLRACDITYRRLHGLTGPAAEVGPILRVRITRYRGHPFAMADGTLIRPGDPIGELHLNNERTAALHDGGGGFRWVGLEARRAFHASLAALAERVGDAPRYGALKAFTATTIFYHGTERMGFQVRPLPRPLVSRVVAATQRCLLAHFHPLGRRRPGRRRFAEARQIWISRDELLRRYASERSSARDTHA